VKTVNLFAKKVNPFCKTEMVDHFVYDYFKPIPSLHK